MRRMIFLTPLWDSGDGMFSFLGQAICRKRTDARRKIESGGRRFILNPSPRMTAGTISRGRTIPLTPVISQDQGIFRNSGETDPGLKARRSPKSLKF
jgi:hypothetical protein